MSVKQRTLKAEFSLKGKGLHTGKEVCVTFKPAEENSGYKIIRTDVEGRPVVPALAEYVKFVERASCLEKTVYAYIPWNMPWQLFTVAVSIIAISNWKGKNFRSWTVVPVFMSRLLKRPEFRSRRQNDAILR